MGKMFFYSDQVNESPGNKRLDQLLFEGMDTSQIKIGYIPSTKDKEQMYFKEKASYYRQYGVSKFLFFDLYEGYNASTITELVSCDIIHLSAGNPNTLRDALHHRGMNRILTDYVQQGGCLVGVSAGAVQFGNSTHLYQLHMGATEEALDTLQLVPFDFLPHYNRWNEAYKREVQAYARSTGKFIYAGNDGDGLMVEDGRIQLIGEIVRIDGQEHTP